MPSLSRARWSRNWTLTHRILAVNLLTIVLLAFGVLYLDAFRNQLSEERLNLIRRETMMTANTLATVPQPARHETILALARASDSRIRLYGTDGDLIADSWRGIGPSYSLRDPDQQRWTKDLARAADRGFNFLVGANPLNDFVEPPIDRVSSWPEALQAQAD
jgi:two-component system sensor histidine kinase ChvG